MNIIEPRRDVVVVGDKSLDALDALEAEWREWTPPPSRRSDVVPPGWITATDYQRIANVDARTARRRLHRGVKAGEIEMRVFRLIRGLGGLVPVAHYRIKRKG